ncbi:hypothetical protein GJU43_06950 [Flavobacterium sp. LC2016-23]|uniref:hypothetical protein n=1 Tax=Flavobacterium sp. LC2016-23 TaxID=2666330 RepID=UPI0012B0DB50|nr:hypothetical protein [Flavobacterium sp. LC2016-23]MRX39007.1 hypothetical protein [Flavobacterium sp. LC2016-23]
MTEKNYDPDNDNCPEKDTVENLHKRKQSTSKTESVEEFIDDSPNRIPSDKVKDLKQKFDTKK